MTGWRRAAAYDIPILIGRDEARRRAEEELAKAKYGGTPDWLSDALRPGSSARRAVHRAAGRLASGPAGAGTGINWGFLIAVASCSSPSRWSVWRVGLPRWRRRRAAPGRLEPDPTVRPADYRDPRRAQAVRRRLARARCATGSGRWSASSRRGPSWTSDRPVRRWRPPFGARAPAGLPEALCAGAEDFNAVVYGDRPADDAAYGRMVAARRRRHRSGRRRRPGRADESSRGAGRRARSVGRPARPASNTAGRRRAGRGGVLAVGLLMSCSAAAASASIQRRRPSVHDAQRHQGAGAAAAGRGRLDRARQTVWTTPSGRPVRAAPWSWPSPTD